jgi:hypothetical protein
MSVNTLIVLPADTRSDDVADVIGILMGGKPDFILFGGRTPGGYVKVEGVEIKTTSFYRMAEIIVRGTLIDGKTVHFVSYHFEGSKGQRLLSPCSTALWIAVGLRLIKFFGGKMIYKDSAPPRAGHYDRSFPTPKRGNSHEDGKKYADFQQELLHLKPLTSADLKKWERRAAYEEAYVAGEYPILTILHLGERGEGGE